MTEQEKREKAIEEIEKIMSGICKKVEVCPCNTCSECKAMSIYDACYRKADEVRKETAKEIIKELIGHRFAYYYEDEKYGTKTCLADYVVDKEDVKWLVDKFGVEVEE